ncbi:hypothetical protein NQ314_009032 [Rhamnusium bicolor]|uniref:Uncharacterized protein n=1 Tax=Rhamnusium bicolor TaxID=1586634 RepID=A0AAV8Y5T2_9CUCU|nr:hypothetical protein NQ314_009032 [Rhamnusium bicolor]
MNFSATFGILPYKNSCRTCLTTLIDDSLKNCIFKENIYDKIVSFASVNLCQGNGLSNFICNFCVEKLKNALEFKNQVEASDKILTEYNNKLSIKTDEILDAVINTSKYEIENNRIQKGDLVNIKEEDLNKSEISDDGQDNELAIYENESKTDKKSNKSSKTHGKSKNKFDEVVQKTLYCLTCSKEFPTTTSLKIHLRIHSVRKKLVCDECGKKYSNQYDLIVHLRKHSGVRPFSCKSCQKSFADQRCFEKHKKIHSGEKNHQCTICPKSFSGAAQLKTHMRVHTGVKPYICSVCSCKFSQSGSLSTHLKTHYKNDYS